MKQFQIVRHRPNRPATILLGFLFWDYETACTEMRQLAQTAPAGYDYTIKEI